MSTKAEVICTGTLAVMLFSIAIAISPTAVVERFLPREHIEYYERLVNGLSILRVALIIDGLLLLALPHLRRRYFSQMATVERHEPISHAVLIC